MRKTIFLLLLVAPVIAFTQQTSPAQYKEDFEYLWKTIDDNYCYFQKKNIDWNSMKSFYAAQVDTVHSRDAFITVTERVLYELFDHHVSLRTRTNASMRLVPTSADIWAEYKNGKPVVTEVRKDFGAAKEGVVVGMEVLSINDIPVDKAIQPFLGHNANKTEAKNYALRTALAGDHNTKRKITLLVNGKPKDFFPDKDGMMLEDVTYPALVESKVIGDVAYIKINNFLFDNNLIPAFDSVLDKLLDKPYMIIDMRETPSGGNTAVARAILGRFITKEHFYQKHELWAEEKETGIKRSWEEIVSPRKKPYLHPLVIIADHWTGSVSEGITIAFEGMKRATVIGTPLAGLNGAVESFEMPNTKIGFNITTERLYHINGTPREFFKPNIEVVFNGQPQKDNEDKILSRAIEFLHQHK